MISVSPRANMLLAMSLLLGLLFGSPVSLLAESGKHRIDDQTVRQQKHNPRYFRTLPAVQIVPRQDSFIFSFNYAHTDLTSNFKDSSVAKPTNESLKLNGLSVQPLIAYTNDGFGLGLSGEFSEGNSTYTNHLLQVEEVGKMRYRGAGLHGFYNPTPKAKHIYLSANASFEGLSIQQSANDRPPVADQGEYEVSYLAYRLRTGLNLNLKPVKFLAIIPWGQFSFATSSKTLTGKDSENNLNARMLADRDYFVGNGAQVEYGLDITIKIYKFDLHCGNIIRNILTAQNSSTNKQLTMHDQSFSIGISLQTGNDPK